MRLLFASPHNLLDSRSGAAACVRTLLMRLAGRGWACRAVTASLSDAHDPIPVEAEWRRWGARAVGSVNGRPLLGAMTGGVEHYVLATEDSRRTQMRAYEENFHFQLVQQQLDEFKPELVLGYGGLLLERAIFREARRRGVPTVFYLANLNYQLAEVFEDASAVVAASGFLSEWYRRGLGVESSPLGPFIDLDAVRHVGPDAAREWITFVNPAPEKGLGMVLELARRALELLPEAKFLLVAGRWDAVRLASRYGIDWSALPNVHWLENQLDMRPVYAATRVLLFPSLCQEGFGRTLIEAMANGIPCLASPVGGVPEAVAGAGGLIVMPATCFEDPMAALAERDVQPWLAALARLWGDPVHYAAAVARAAETARAYDLSGRVARVEALFKGLAAAKG